MRRRICGWHTPHSSHSRRPSASAPRDSITVTSTDAATTPPIASTCASS